LTAIARVETWPVNVPLQAPYLMAPGTYPGMSRTIVRVTTVDGLVGLGEGGDPGDARIISAQPFTGLDTDELRLALGATTVGPRPRPRRDARVVAGHPLAPVEVALCDIAAREAGLPLCEWLGGARRRDIPVSEYFAYRPGLETTPADVARYCARMTEEHGAWRFEGKVAVRALDEDLRLVRAVRAAIGPSAALRLDANMGWSEPTAERAVELLSPYGIENLEEPVAGVDALARLRSRTEIPFSVHDLDIEALAGAVDAIVVSAQACGGIEGTRRTVDAADGAGLRFWFYSGDLGVATATHLHLAAALPTIGAGQSLLRWTADDVIDSGPFAVRDGAVRLPDGPGLGVELDEQALRRCADRFAREGPYDYYTGPPLPRH
jgi:glucarate dehydratase